MKIGKLIQILEKDRLNYIGIFIFVLFLGAIRKYFEHVFIYKSIDTELAAYYGMMFTQLSVFLVGTLILSYFSKEKIKKVMNVAVLVVWLIALPPVVDTFVFDVPDDFVYFDVKILSTNDLVEIFTAGTSTGHSPGIIMIGAIIVILAGIYLFIKTRSVLKTVVGGSLFYTLCLLLAGQFYNIIFILSGISLLAGLRPLLISFVLSFLIFYNEGRKLALVMLKSMKPFKNLYFILLVMVGILIGGNYGHPLVYLTQTVIRILIITFIWQFTVILNNIFDKDIDKIQKRITPITLGIINKKTYLQLGIIFAVMSILMSLLMNNFIFVIITSLALLSAIIYSSPPFRLRKYLFSTWFIGLGSVIAYLIGYFSEGDGIFLVNISPPITMNIIYLMIILFTAVTIGTTIKDVEDYKGDKKTGIRTLITIYGLEKGKKITSILLFLSFLIPILLFNSILEILFFSIVATFAVILFRKLESQDPVIFISFLIFIYCALRLSGVVILI